MRMPSLPDCPPARQRGAALLIILVIVGISAAFLLVSALNKANRQIERDKDTYAVLAQAKEALISWTIVPSGVVPGQMPLPDALAPYDATFENPALNYDGDSDQGCVFTTWAPGAALRTSGTTMRCLGRLPWKSLSLALQSTSQNDSAGTMPWYAVSTNLIDACFQNSINPNVLNAVYPGGYNCAAAGQLPYPWLTVRDERGNVLSNRVAAVIIMPGPAVGGQTRPDTPLAGPAAYLDSVTVATGCTAPCVPGTYNNASLNPGNDFIMGKDSGQVTATDPNYAQPYNFNDKLVYITIDELMAAAEKRAALEARRVLLTYYTNSALLAANRFFPYAADVGYLGKNCVESKHAGFLPLVKPTCSCDGFNCTCSGNGTLANPDTFTASTNFTAVTGACTGTGSTTCSCTGYGTCTGPTSVTVTTPNSTIISAPGCTPATIIGSSTCNCGSYAGSCSISSCTHPNPTLSGFPAWFSNSGWENFIYYTTANSCTFAVKGCSATPYLTVGSNTAVQALLISTGRPVTSVAGQTPAMVTPPYAGSRGANQATPSANINDYLDSLENTNGDDIYDAVGTARSTIYNDQMIVVAP